MSAANRTRRWFCNPDDCVSLREEIDHEGGSPGEVVGSEANARERREVFGEPGVLDELERSLSQLVRERGLPVFAQAFADRPVQVDPRGAHPVPGFPKLR